MRPECPRKDFRGKSWWLRLLKIGPDAILDPCELNHLPYFVLVWNQQNYPILLKSDIYNHLSAASTCHLPKAIMNMGMKIIQQPSINQIFLFFLRTFTSFNCRFPLK